MGKVIAKHIMLLGKKLSVLLSPNSNPHCPRMQGKIGPQLFWAYMETRKRSCYMFAEHIYGEGKGYVWSIIN